MMGMIKAKAADLAAMSTYSPPEVSGALRATCLCGNSVLQITGEPIFRVMTCPEPPLSPGRLAARGLQLALQGAAALPLPWVWLLRRLLRGTTALRSSSCTSQCLPHLKLVSSPVAAYGRVRSGGLCLTSSRGVIAPE